jgi:hypothetical protein
VEKPSAAGLPTWDEHPSPGARVPQSNLSGMCPVCTPHVTPTPSLFERPLFRPWFAYKSL